MLLTAYKNQGAVSQHGNRTGTCILYWHICAIESYLPQSQQGKQGVDMVATSHQWPQVTGTSLRLKSQRPRKSALLTLRLHQARFVWAMRHQRFTGGRLGQCSFQRWNAADGRFYPPLPSRTQRSHLCIGSWVIRWWVTYELGEHIKHSKTVVVIFESNLTARRYQDLIIAP